MNHVVFRRLCTNCRSRRTRGTRTNGPASMATRCRGYGKIGLNIPVILIVDFALIYFDKAFMWASIASETLFANMLSAPPTGMKQTV
jgi:hypothetical protein